MIKEFEGQATMAFAVDNYDDAEKLSKQLIKMSANHHRSYHMIGKILQERGELKR